MASPINNPGSSATKPDLDWSQVRETVSMLCLAISQIETTLTDSSKSVGELTDSFTHIAQNAQQVSRLTTQLAPDADFEANKASIIESSQEIMQRMSQAVVAFQFYDRLSQKLGHVNESLSHLGDLLGDMKRLYNPTEWARIQNEIRSNYTMECERLMFDLIMKGATVKEALELYRHEFDQLDAVKSEDDNTEDDIELF